MVRTSALISVALLSVAAAPPAHKPAVPSAPTRPSTPPSVWDYGETKDAMTDKVRARAFVRGTDGSLLGVKCDEPGPDSLYVQFISPKYLGGGGGSGAFRGFMYRVDGGDPVQQEWFYDGNNAILSQSGGTKQKTLDMIHALASAHKIVVRAITFELENVDAAFDVPGAAAAIAHVAATCGAATP